MRLNDEEKAGCIEMSLLFALSTFFFWLLSLWTDRNLEFWLSYFKGNPITVPGWMSFVLTVVLNGVILVANIVGELLRLVVN